MNLNFNNTANNLINWYWSKHNDIPNLAGGNDGLCQCATESFIMRSGDPKTATSIESEIEPYSEYIYWHFEF